MKKIKAVILGFGNRGEVYADYSLQEKDEMEVVAVIDPNPFKRKTAKEKYHLSEDSLFSDWQEFARKKIPCDIVINATMDQIHYKTSLDVLNAGYDMLVEKPIVGNKEELLEIQKTAHKHNANVFVCHVLRYTPFYRAIKNRISNGDIGKVISLEMNEHVEIAHYLTSYDRGKWNDEDTSGSTFLLAKCCHDIDLIQWLNKPYKPKKVASFGSRNTFTKENQPKDATEYCYTCPHVDDCLYSAKLQYLKLDYMPFLTWDRLNKPLDEITCEEKEEFLKHDIYGKCAYTCGGRLVDRQNVIYAFDNGSIASFTLTAGTSHADRYIHVIGMKGEIEGKVLSNKLVIRHPYQEDEILDLSDKVINKAVFGGHYGGDYGIMHDIVRFYNGDDSSPSLTKLDDSVQGHLCVYAADQSRREERIIKDFL